MESEDDGNEDSTHSESHLDEESRHYGDSQSDYDNNGSQGESFG